MRRLLTTRAGMTSAILAGLTLFALLGAPSSASAATNAHAFAPPIASVGSFLGGIVGSVIGGVSWTVNLAGSFILNLIGGLVKLLIPRSWIHQGLQILEWVVAVPDYTGKVTAPGGHRVYGFPGVNAMRGLYTWIGIAILPLTALYATSRAWSGQGDHVAMPLIRVVTVSIGVLSYTWLWAQAVAIANQLTTMIFSVSAVTAGIYKMFTLLVSGTVLVGLPLVGEFLLAAAAAGLLTMIFLKVVLILVGALVYAIGPLMIGLAPTERGHALARAWASLAIALFAIGILWASVFALAAVLLNDASTGALLVGGNTSVGQLLSGVVIAMAAIAGFYANIKLTKAIAGIIGGQLSGLLAQVGSRGGAGGLLGGAASRGAGPTASPAGAAGASLRGFAAKIRGGIAGAAGAALPGGRAGAMLSVGAGAGGALARGGLIGAGGVLAGRGLAGAARSNVGRAAGATRAGAVATRLARGGQRGWNAAAASAAAGGAVGLVGGATAANRARRTATTTVGKQPTNGTTPTVESPATTRAPGDSRSGPPTTPGGASSPRGTVPGPALAPPAASVRVANPDRAAARPSSPSPPPAAPGRPGGGPPAPPAAPSPRSSAGPPPARSTPAAGAPPARSTPANPFAQRPTPKPSRSLPRFRKGRKP